MIELRRCALLLLGASLIAGCGRNGGGTGGTTTAGGRATLQGTVTIDGSSTVFPISEAAAEEFRKVQPGVNVTVGESGTGGGFKKFINGELDIADASRLISESEIEGCKKAGIEYIELLIAYDGLAVVVNKSNTFLDCIKVSELKEIWKPDSKVKKWSDVNPAWPKDNIELYGPGTSSGTFDYFTEVIVGKARSSRSDYTGSEDDNVLVSGVAADKSGMGYFGYAYYAQNQDKLKIVGIDNGKGCVVPSEQTVLSGEYAPLSRPLFIYINKKSLERPEVKGFVDFYLENVGKLAREVKYVQVPDEQAKKNKSLIGK